MTISSIAEVAEIIRATGISDDEKAQRKRPRTEPPTDRTSISLSPVWTTQTFCFINKYKVGSTHCISICIEITRNFNSNKYYDTSYTVSYNMQLCNIK